MNAEKPLSTPEDAPEFLKPAGTASLCKLAGSTPNCLLLPGSSSSYLPLEMSPTFPLCVRMARGTGRLSGLGQSQYHRGLPTPGPADAVVDQVAASGAQILGRN